MPENDPVTFQCENCGGDLKFKPGARALACPYCGTENEIAADQGQTVRERDFLQALRDSAASEEMVERITFTCDSCGAEITFEENVTASECAYCGSNIVAQSHSCKQIKPKSLLPFKITRDQVRANFKAWLRKRWFLPNRVKKFARMRPLNGVYAPFWTYDCRTVTYYTGSRGEYYYTRKTYTTRRNGKTVTRTKRVRRTRWHSVRGAVSNSFDDLLILASKSLPKKYAEQLEPWDLPELEPYSEEFLSGFKVESYAVDLEGGFVEAQGLMEGPIRRTVKRDIGGDRQRISSTDVSYQNITFKHILLPVWISAYRFKDQVFRFLVNARTGEVQGERPWSWVKITLLVLTIAALIAGFVVLLPAGCTRGAIG